VKPTFKLGGYDGDIEMDIIVGAGGSVGEVGGGVYGIYFVVVEQP
jgi:hypothetical protein